MAVKQVDIDLKKALDAAAGKNAPDIKKKNNAVEPDLATALAQAANPTVKKKDGGEPSTTVAEDVPDGAVPGTTSTTKPTPIKWEDNPLNPAKAANEFEAKRDKTPELLFKEADKEKLNTLVSKHKVVPAVPVTKPLSWIEDPDQTLVKPGIKPVMQVEYETALNLEAKLKSDIDYLKASRVEKREPKSKAEKELETELQEAQVLKRKAFMEMAENGDKEVVVLSRQDDTGNSFKRTMQDMFGSKPGAWQTEKPKIEDKLAKLPTSFMTGMNILKGIEPAKWERVTDAIANGLPISQSETTQITNLGLSLEGAKLQRDILKSPVTKAERETAAEINNELETVKTDIEKYEGMIKAKQPLSPDQVQDYEGKIKQYNATVTKYKPLIEKINTIDGAFAKRANEIQEARRKNLVENPEVLRSFISDGVANKLDEIGKNNPLSKKRPIGTFLSGHTWNYSDEQIKWAAEEYLKEEGIDPTTPQAQAAIKFLQDNEGVMIGENSIAKAGGFREFGAGFIEPLEGVSKFIDGKTRSLNDIYAESQSEGNVKVARKRLESEEEGVRGVMNEVLKGTGQFVSQAAMMAATSGAIGTLAKGIMGRSGVQLLADAKAAGIKPIVPFDDATAHIATGNFINKSKDVVAVFTTSYAMSYDGNLKAALSYTSDNELAKRAAAFNASMEGATELFLSPLDIARGIISKFSKSQTKDLLTILSDKSLKDDPSKLKEYVSRFVKGVLGTAKVSSAEIGEEYVTQISDYVTNLYLNPESDSFKNRDLAKELMTTTYQTGLSMALPALLNGIGAARANSFSKGSLMVAAQNRQAMIDDLNKSVATGAISQDYATEQIQLINTAAVANSQLPKKADGADINTDEKANYIWSRTTEAYMEKKVSSTTDAAEKEIWKDKILKQQEYRKGILGLKDEVTEAPEYLIDDKPVSREEFLKTIEKKPDGNYVVTGDEEARDALRKIGGIDDKTDSEVTSAVIEIDGKVYEGKNHAEAILKAKAEGKDISKVDRKGQGKFKLADGTIIDRSEAKKRYGQDRSELLIEQDEAADAANKEYRKTDKDLVTEAQDKNVPGYEKTSIKELKEQAIGTPNGFKNSFNDEELTVDLISRNSEEQIENAIAYQQEKLQAPDLNEIVIKEIDRHIKLLELGLERNKEFAEAEKDIIGDEEYNAFIDTGKVSETRLNEIADKVKKQEKLSGRETEIFTDKTSDINKIIAGEKPLSKLEQLKAKKLAAKALTAKKEQPVTENDIIQKWLDKEYENLDGADVDEGYISFEWDGETLEIFQSRNKAPLEFSRDELIEQGVDLPYNGKEPEFPDEKRHTDSVMPAYRFEDVSDETLDKIIADFNKAQEDEDDKIKRKTRDEKIVAISGEYLRSKAWEENPEFIKAVEDAVKPNEKKPKAKSESILAFDETETETIKGLTGKRIFIGDYTGIVTFASVEKGKFELHDEKGQIKKVHFKDSELVDENDVPVTVAKKVEQKPDEDAENQQGQRKEKKYTIADLAIIDTAPGYHSNGYPDSFISLYTDKRTVESVGKLTDPKIGDTFTWGKNEWVIEAFDSGKKGNVKLLRIDEYGNLLREKDLPKNQRTKDESVEEDEVEEDNTSNVKTERIAELEKEKQAKINEVTKPLVQPDTGVTLIDLAGYGVTEQMRQEHGDIRQKLFSLRNLINCLWA